MLGPTSGIKFTTVLIPVTMYDTRPLGKKNLVQLGDAVRGQGYEGQGQGQGQKQSEEMLTKVV